MDTNTVERRRSQIRVKIDGERAMAREYLARAVNEGLGRFDGCTVECVFCDNLTIARDKRGALFVFVA